MTGGVARCRAPAATHTRSVPCGTTSPGSAGGSRLTARETIGRRVPARSAVNGAAFSQLEVRRPVAYPCPQNISITFDMSTRPGGPPEQPDERLGREPLRAYRRIEPHRLQVDVRDYVLELLTALTEAGGHERPQRRDLDVHDQRL